MTGREVLDFALVDSWAVAVTINQDTATFSPFGPWSRYDPSIEFVARVLQDTGAPNDAQMVVFDTNASPSAADKRTSAIYVSKRLTDADETCERNARTVLLEHQ